ncbi:hypothetical protein [Alicyclobacillus sp. ALC3]|uniref:hypothetical protein n=1 Tax=Alicyclobacillus sp. ALC3 TaxID=2796143 RepID=UPI002378263B|nr:hypothetical protein [Alicyclobacillus sp. ALC3]WDL95857.1 hypothetical protein JC200_16045 [Alicyclobacillus sp. ALC3]
MNVNMPTPGLAAIGIIGIIVGIILPLVALILSITLIVAIFQTRNATRETAQRLNDIYRLLVTKQNSDK